MKYRLEILQQIPEENLYAKIDRLRRVRNEFAHEAHTFANIEIVSEYLSKVARYYLKELFRNSDKYSNEEDNDIISL
ncbi:MAG: hypothetical protein ACPGVB_05840 [Chitinophagales bacterium]